MSRAVPRLALLIVWLLALTPVGAWAAIPVVPVRVVQSYPHDPAAFTEGLFFQDGLLFESTGLEGRSSIRKVELATGRVLNSIDLPAGVFGEGIVDWKDEIVSVTWHGGAGFRWSLADFGLLGQFGYEGEGWALTQDGRDLILSDGTPVLRFLDPATLQVTRRLTVTADGVPVEKVNELEYVKGEILANIWLTNRIARIDPQTGAVKGWIDVSALATRIGATDPDEVPNGIAYDAAHDRLFVTGKRWPLLFEVRY
ncbi:MAG: glutaminyl-peptide cyclotransferase [Caulobacter sp.]|nr:glutaminyl-peptide cyclotransferase [Caulobacter sp.]